MCKSSVTPLSAGARFRLAKLLGGDRRAPTGRLKVRCARGFGGTPTKHCKGASSESYAHKTHTHIICVSALKGPGKSAKLTDQSGYCKQYFFL